jgi:hypothetical protein
LANAGIIKIIFGEFYHDKRIFEAANQANIELKHFKLEDDT